MSRLASHQSQVKTNLEVVGTDKRYLPMQKFTEK